MFSGLRSSDLKDRLLKKNNFNKPCPTCSPSSQLVRPRDDEPARCNWLSCCPSLSNSSSQGACCRVMLARAKNILRCLSTQELDTLVNLIETAGVRIGECLLLDRSRGNKHVSPVCSSSSSTDCDYAHALCWSRLASRVSAAELLFVAYRLTPAKKAWSSEDLIYLPWCLHPQSQRNLTHLCINPYHWCVLIRSDVTLDDYSSFVPPKANSTPHESFSYSGFSFNNCSTSGKTKKAPWCKIAYWEINKRVGPLLSVTESMLNITAKAQQCAQIASFSLDALFASDTSSHVPKSVARVREQIGAGVTLFKDDDNNVWLYNRSCIDLFVNSPTLERPRSLRQEDIQIMMTALLRVSPGDLIKVLDSQVALKIESLWKSFPNSHPRHFSSFRVSFKKGYGEHYSRQDILSCPCWFEVMMP